MGEARECAEHEAGLPTDPQIYEREYEYWPWGLVMKHLTSWVSDHAPQQARILDYMCGTGFLLGEVLGQRPDTKCFGCSTTRSYIEHGRDVYKGVTLDLSDARDYAPHEAPDVVICAAGLHHLHWDEQEEFLAKMAGELAPGGALVIAEELVEPWKDENARRRAVLRLLCGSLDYMLSRGAPDSVVVAGLRVLEADLFGAEFKFDKETLLAMVERHLELESYEHIWPDNGDSYGDAVVVGRKR